MQLFKQFIFKSYTFNAATRTASFVYQLDGALEFTETITWPADNEFAEYSESELQHALFALHIVLGISYYKAYLPTTIVIESGKLTSQQAKFWQTVYEKGLGEFWYQNKLDWRGRIHFPALATAKALPHANSAPHYTYTNPLVPIGGGKDSIVTMELLKQTDVSPTLFRVGSHPLIQAQAQQAALPLLNVSRRIDPLLHECSANGAYNGHVPVTAINSFIAIVTAIVFGHDAIIFSNERSANEGNAELYGLEVNHQWSKSYEFETMLQSYIADFVSPTLYVTSLLRPVSEVAIAKIFTRYPQYFSISTSCNANWRIWKAPSDTLWGTDEKSAFVFALLAPYLSEAELLSMFGQNLLDNPAILETYKALLGQEGIKPFECVGTATEVQYSFLQAFMQHKFVHTTTMRYFAEQVAPTLPSVSTLERAVFSVSGEHALVPSLLTLLQNNL
jgi:hypothetical protein